METESQRSGVVNNKNKMIKAKLKSLTRFNVGNVRVSSKLRNLLMGMENGKIEACNGIECVQCKCKKIVKKVISKIAKVGSQITTKQK